MLKKCQCKLVKSLLFELEDSLEASEPVVSCIHGWNSLLEGSLALGIKDDTGDLLSAKVVMCPLSNNSNWESNVLKNLLLDIAEGTAVWTDLPVTTAWLWTLGESTALANNNDMVSVGILEALDDLLVDGSEEVDLLVWNSDDSA